MTAEVVRLIDRTPGIACSDVDDLCDWLTGWASAMKEGDYGDIRTVVVVVENDEGRLGVISQSLNILDGARLCGLLTLAAHRKADGRATMDEL